VPSAWIKPLGDEPSAAAPIIGTQTPQTAKTTAAARDARKRGAWRSIGGWSFLLPSVNVIETSRHARSPADRLAGRWPIW
jgi:hypothetical protein